MKVLIIRFSSIGDIVLTTPVIRGLKQQLGAEVHFLTKASFRPVLEANPYIDELILMEKTLNPVLSRLKANRYDYIIDLHNNLRSLKVKLLLGAPSSSFDKINREKWLMVNFKIDRLPKVHIVDRYMETVASLGVKNDGQGLDYFIKAEDEVDLKAFFQGLPFAQSSSFNYRYIAFVIGAAHATKCLPVDKIIRICRQISIPVILLGGPDEMEMGQDIAIESGEHVINSCGKLRLNQSASLVRQAWKVISHDTGLMHIAAAYRKDIFSVCGNTIPGFGMYPYLPEGKGRSSIFEVNGLSCRPCSKIGFNQCPKKHFRCMNRIMTDQLARLANEEEIKSESE